MAVWTFIKVAVFSFLIAFGTLQAWRFWETSPLIRVENVVYQGHLPRELKQSLPLHIGDNLFQIPVRRLVSASLASFPELETLSIRRNFNRVVVVEGTYRVPVALLFRDQAVHGVDAAGFVFPLPPAQPKSKSVPILEGIWSEEDLQRVSKILSLFKTGLPSFYLRLAQLKTDTMQRLEVALVDGILIYWGEANLQNALEKGQKIEALLKRFRPTREGATLRFVDARRVVLDSYWVEAEKI